MDDALLNELIDFLERHTGLRTPASNVSHLRRVFARHAQDAGVDPRRYVELLRRDPPALERLLNAVLIGETYFFREAAQFRLLREVILPQLFAAKRELRCWSVSCSTGEEAVSLAAVLDDYCRAHAGTTFTVYASDINSASLARLREGAFPISALRRDGDEFHALLNERYVAERDARTVRVTAALRERIVIRHLNVYRDALTTIPDEIDVAFFRNTLLYAGAEQRAAIVARLAPKLADGAYLFFATSELPFVVHPELRMHEMNRVYFMRRMSGAGERATSDALIGADEKRPGSVIPATQPRDSAAEARGAHAVPRTIETRVDGNRLLDLLNDGTDATGASGETDSAPPPDPTVLAVRLIVDCYAAVNAGRLDRAAAIVDELCVVAGEAAAARYCCGWFHYAAGNRKEALEALDGALELDARFWPARFYRAVVALSDGDAVAGRRAARREFERCVAAIDAAGPSERERFAFLLEGFNAAYFRRMCERWIEKLVEEGRSACR